MFMFMFTGSISPVNLSVDLRRSIFVSQGLEGKSHSTPDASFSVFVVKRCGATAKHCEAWNLFCWAVYTSSHAERRSKGVLISSKVSYNQGINYE